MFAWPTKSEEGDEYPEQSMQEIRCNIYQTDEVAYINGETINFIYCSMHVTAYIATLALSSKSAQKLSFSKTIVSWQVSPHFCHMLSYL